eukprot:Em0015g288a
MCILFLSYQPSDPACQYVLVAANNRDEFFNRRTFAACYWSDYPTILAGRDVGNSSNALSTWLGITTTGRFSALTNVRCHAKDIRPDAISRGQVVTDYLLGTSSPTEYCRTVLKHGSDYNGFNLVTAQLSGSKEAVYCSNVTGSCLQVLQPGTYGLSNAQLDSPWRKVVYGQERFATIISKVTPSLPKEDLTEELLQLLSDTTCLHPDPIVPDTGFTEELVKALNSVHVAPTKHAGYSYGTRTSTVLLVDRQGVVTFTEKTLADPVDPLNPVWERRNYTMQIQ